jgi:uncharacterized membrane protein
MTPLDGHAIAMVRPYVAAYAQAAAGAAVSAAWGVGR